MALYRFLFRSTPLLLLVAQVASAQPFDHLQCYSVADGQHFKAATVQLTALQARFQIPASCKLKGSAVQVCVPANKTVVDPGDAPVPPLLPAGQDLSANDYVCYKLKCPKVAVPPTEFTDQFGFRTTRLKSVTRLCVPAVEGRLTTTTTTTSTTTTLPAEVDQDGDGWSPSTGDCCENTSCTANPQYVNPGALEVVGNGLDDDCDPSTSDSSASPACSTATKFAGVTSIDAAAALDLCQTTSESATLPERKWGLIASAFRLANGQTPSPAQLSTMQNSQAASLTNYGSVVLPTLNNTMAGLSTGPMRDKNDPGYVAVNPGTSFGVSSTPPAAYLAAHGGSLPPGSCGGVCASDSDANDPVSLHLRVRVPTNATSVSFDFRYFNADYESWTCTTFNDYFLALLTSAAAGLPADGNIAVDGASNPISLNHTRFDFCTPVSCNTCPLGTADLAGTGMEDGGSGAGTAWITATAPVVHGEVIELDLMVFDVGDDRGDSLALLDHLRWGLAVGVPAP